MVRSKPIVRLLHLVTLNCGVPAPAQDEELMCYIPHGRDLYFHTLVVILR